MMAKWEGEVEGPDINEVVVIEPILPRKPEQWEEPVGKTEPIVINSAKEMDDAFDKMIAKIGPSFLDTLGFRDDLNKAQVKMAKRAIESLRGMIKVGWIREE
jgi:hypothetical protein